MKTIFFTFLFVVSLLIVGINVSAQANLSLADKQQITDNLDSLVQAINAGDTQKISSLISSDNPTLQTNVQERIRGGIPYQLDYIPFDKNVEILSPERVKVKARYAASGVGWSISGLSAYFVFEKQNGQWLITDTDINTKLGIKYALGIAGKVFLFFAPLLILFFAFWVGMLIDCIKRDFADKTLWIILLIFLNTIAAILYYFIIKRKNVIRKPLEFKT